MTKNRDKRYPVAIDDLLVEFDEMDYCPMNLSGDDPVKEAIVWRDRLRYELDLLLDEKSAIERRAVEEFVEKLKEKAHKDDYTITESELNELLRSMKIERLTRELDDTICMNEMYIKKVKQNAKLQKKVDKLKLIVKNMEQGYYPLTQLRESMEEEKSVAVKEFAEKLKNVIHERDYVQGYAEIGLIEEIDELLKEYKNDFSKY